MSILRVFDSKNILLVAFLMTLMTVNQISTKLGFEYPQHFVRFFKQHTGKTPSEYRNTV